VIAEALAAAVSSTEGASLAPVLARIGGPLGEQARELVRARSAAAEAERRPLRGRWIVAARAPLPPGMRAIHPSWIEAALSGVPGRARAVLSGSAPATPSPLDGQIDVWLARWACASFPAMPPVDDSLVRPRVPAEIARMSAAAAMAWLAEVGADQVAFAVGDAVSQFGPQVIAAAGRITKAPRVNELGPRRDAIERAHVDAPAWRQLHVIGARTIAPHIDALTASVLVHRLDRAIGVGLRDELRASGSSSSPATWRAITAA
jgi:hypothetical protein